MALPNPAARPHPHYHRTSMPSAWHCDIASNMASSSKMQAASTCASGRMGAGRAASWLVSRARQGRVLVRLGMRHGSAGAGTWACQAQLLTSGRKYAVRA
jgi:hypothetical protein